MRENLGDFIREHRSEILREWEIASTPAAQQLDRSSLIDELPAVLERMGADWPAGSSHTLHRVDDKLDLAELVSELSVLRDTVARVWQRATGGRDGIGCMRALNRVVDHLLAASIGRYTEIAVENARLYKESQEAVFLRENILAIVSHDLRNPLGAIELSATQLDTLVFDPRGRHAIDVIRRSVGRMNHLIGDLLDMARIRSGTFAIEPAPEDAGRLLEEIVDLHEGRASERKLQVVREYELDGVRVIWDRDRIVQAMGNLMGNAIKFCRPGDTITVRGRRRGQHVELEIRDTGPGIAAEHLSHLFSPYWSTRHQNRQGTGLGLYICRAIVEAHRGSITAASELGCGATFSLKLPLRV